MPQEKKHRLSPEAYRGWVSVAFTACLRFAEGGQVDDETAKLVEQKLGDAAGKHGCVVSVWCLMPDHLHVIFTGVSATSDTWKAMVAFKQQTGFWLTKNRPNVFWQKDFYDHVIRTEANADAQAWYIMQNPVRAGLVSEWFQYPYLGGYRVEGFRAEYGVSRIG